MKAKDNIIIVGAGPSGLAAALFLLERGIKPRVIDKSQGISQHSKALGVNPRTLALLEDTGLTQRFLNNGRKLDKINIWKQDKHIFQNDLSRVKHKFPFMLIQPQKESEAILLEELDKRKLQVEFETTLSTLKNTEKGIALCYSRNNEALKEENFSFVIGADGAGSTTRKQLGIKFEGFQYEEEWEIYDVRLDVELARDQGHIRLFKEGGMVMIRLKENIWRVGGNIQSLFNYLPKKCQVGEIIWQSKFKISHRIAENLQQNKAVIIGDAAHVHSPIGARGMNLGIEDAYLVSRLLAEDRMDKYNTLRKGYLERTVKRINQLTQVLTGHHFLSRTVRANIEALSIFFPVTMPVARKFIMGLNK